MLEQVNYIPSPSKKEQNSQASHLAKISRDDAKIALVKRGAPLYIKWVELTKRDNKTIPLIDVNLLSKIGVKNDRDKRAIRFVQDKVPNVKSLALNGNDIPAAYIEYIDAKRKGNRKNSTA